MKYKSIFFIGLCTFFLLAGCQKETLPADSPSSIPEENQSAASSTDNLDETPSKDSSALQNTVDLLLTAPPTLSITDLLSSKATTSQDENLFTLDSSTYQWDYLENGEILGIVACGSSPLEIDMDSAKKLKLPEYQSMDTVDFLISSVIPPDKITVKTWSTTLAGTDAKPSKTDVYEAPYLIPLEKNRIYEFVAVWDEKKQNQRSFSGEASYVLVTE